MTNKIILILEAWAEDEKLFESNLIYAFFETGIKIGTINNLGKLGIKIVYVFDNKLNGGKLNAKTVEKNSLELEKKLKKIKDTEVIILMGDTAIKAINYVGKRRLGQKVIPSGSTYKIRNGQYYLGKIRLLPSYLPTGRNFVIEKSKQKMVIEDLKLAISLVS